LRINGEFQKQKKTLRFHWKSAGIDVSRFQLLITFCFAIHVEMHYKKSKYCTVVDFGRRVKHSKETTSFC